MRNIIIAKCVNYETYSVSHDIALTITINYTTIQIYIVSVFALIMSALIINYLNMINCVIKIKYIMG